jgi:hypothetical protein
MSAHLDPPLLAFCCPTCGHKAQAKAVPLERLDLFVTAPMQRRILRILAATPRGCQIPELVSLVYTGPDGGPTSAASSVWRQVSLLRKTLAPLGWALTKGWGKGVRTTIQLVPLDIVNQTG